MVHGCFWHRHAGCRFAAVPATRVEFWREKFRKNKARDRRAQKALEALGWRVITVWECETKRDGLTELLVQRLGGKAKPTVKARRR
jgi:DNA mismatch endonuclease (patch repair protein)